VNIIERLAATGIGSPDRPALSVESVRALSSHRRSRAIGIRHSADLGEISRSQPASAAVAAIKRGDLPETDALLV
jgi:hypothetical protein